MPRRRQRRRSGVPVAHLFGVGKSYRVPRRAPGVRRQRAGHYEHIAGSPCRRPRQPTQSHRRISESHRGRGSLRHAGQVGRDRSNRLRTRSTHSRRRRGSPRLAVQRTLLRHFRSFRSAEFQRKQDYHYLWRRRLDMPRRRQPPQSAVLRHAGSRKPALLLPQAYRIQLPPEQYLRRHRLRTDGGFARTGGSPTSHQRHIRSRAFKLWRHTGAGQSRKRIRVQFLAYHCAVRRRNSTRTHTHRPCRP